MFRVEHPENASVFGHNVTVLPDGENAIMLSALHIIGASGLDVVAA